MLQAYHTTPKRFIGEMPFSITYRTEVIILAKIGLSSMRVSDFTPESNDASIDKQLDFLEEQREMALIRLANYQQKLAQRYDRGIRPREFVARDLVLWKAMGNIRDLGT